MPTKFWRHYEIKVKISTASSTDKKERGKKGLFVQIDLKLPTSFGQEQK